MPAKGTKKKVIAGRTVYLPAEQAEIEDLVQRGLELTAKVTLAREELAEIKGRLVAIAKRHRGAKGTVHLLATAGRAVVSFRRETRIDGVTAERLREDLGESWSQVFATAVEYRLSRSYRGWVKGAKRGLKAKVAEAVDVIPRAPQVKLTTEGVSDG